ncbi:MULTISPECIES: hypothetical protein [Chitinophagaceae]
MTTIVLFIFYLFVFCYWLYRWGRSHALDRVFPNVLLIAFLVRIGIGLVFAHYTRDIAGNDSWRLFGDSLEETDWLLHDTPKFLYKDILDNNGYAGNPFTSFFFRNGNNMYFNDLKDNLVIKFNAVLNVFSGSNYYINVLIANFLLMWCLLALSRVFRYWLQPQWCWTVIGILLFYPPLLIWTSNVQKDMLSLMLLGIILYTCSFPKEKKRVLYWITAGLAWMLLLLTKNYMAILLAGCFTMAWLARPSSAQFSKRLLLLTIGVLFLFALSSFFPDSINFPLLLARKQHGFYEVNGEQPIPSIPLTGHIGSYISNLPHAVMGVFFFPLSKDLLTDRIGWLGMCSCFLFVVLTGLAIRYPRKGNVPKNWFFATLFVFCLLTYLLIGESVAYYGALLRYRSVPETMFCMLLLQRINFQEISSLYINKKNI